MTYEELKRLFDSDPAALLDSAGKRGMTFTQYANMEAPQSLLEDKVNVVARLWHEEGLLARSSVFGRATPAHEFFSTPQRTVLLHDYLNRRYQGPLLVLRNALTTGFEDQVGSVLYPGVAGTPRVDKQVAPAFDIGETLATTHDIRGTTYKPFRWSYDGNEDDIVRKPVAPGGPLPVVTLGQKEEAIQLEKWGNMFRLTYEALIEFDAGIDKLGSMIELEGLREQARMLEQLVGVLENGDGTTGSAAETIDQSTLDSSHTAGNLSATGWISFGDEFDAPYQFSHALMRKTQSTQLKLLTLGNANIQVSQLIALGAEGIPGISQMNSTADAIRYAKVPNGAISEHKIAGFDARFAVEMVNMAGMDIQEQANNIRNQTRDVAISNTFNFAKIDFAATKLLDVNA